jgi:membrane protease YdiL (CAAX protease family)
MTTATPLAITARWWEMLLLLLMPPLFTVIGMKIAMISATDTFIHLSVTETLGLLLSLFCYQRLAEVRGWPSLGRCFGGLSLRTAGICIGAALLAKAAAVALGEFLSLTGIDLDDLPDDALSPSDVVGLAIVFPAIVLLGPLWEELFFRGMLFGRLNRSVPTWTAIMISSLIFTLVHDNHYTAGLASIVPFFARFASGAIAALLYLRYKTLSAPYLFHACHNLIAVTVGAAFS